MTYYKIVATENCDYCKQATDLLEANNLDYNVEYVDEMPWFKTILKMAGMTTVPQIFDKDGNHIGGFDALKVQIELELGGG